MLFPLIFPFFFLLLAPVFPILKIGYILVLALMTSGLGYFIFAYIVFLWSKKRSIRTLKIATFFLPILFVPFSLFSSFFVVMIGTVGGSWGDELTLGMSILTLWFGYFYVAISWIIYGMIRIYAFYKP